MFQRNTEQGGCGPSIQTRRFEGVEIYCNANMSGRHIKKYCQINTHSAALLESAIDKLGLSARAYNRILKIARTIADLAGDANLQTRHVSEAIQYRTRN
jgi:magnesium chelatase family protein